MEGALLYPFAVLHRFSCFSQSNLLLNGNFEDINTCVEFKAQCGVEAWYYLKDVKVQSFEKEPGKENEPNTFSIFYFFKRNYKGFTPIIGTILPCNLQEGKQYTFKGRLSVRLSPALILQPGICVGENFFVPGRPFSQVLKTDSIVNLKQVPESAFF
jgi:hypothetical protein